MIYIYEPNVNFTYEVVTNHKLYLNATVPKVLLGDVLVGVLMGGCPDGTEAQGTF